MNIFPVATDGQWDLLDYETGESVVRFTSFLDSSSSRSAAVAEMPVEEGAFTSYNKTVSACDVKVRLAVSGSPAELQAAVDTLDELTGSIRLLAVATPYTLHAPVSLVGASYAFSREGGTSLAAELSLREIRLVGKEYANSGSAGGASGGSAGSSGAGDKGKVRARDASASVKDRAKNVEEA